MKRWYVVHAQRNCESRADHHLRRQGFETYVPRYAKRRRHARRIETVAAPLFPGYLFVRMDLLRARWRSVNGTVGIIRLVCQGEHPIAVPEGIVENLRAHEDESGLHSPASLMVLDRGARLRIVGGAFDDHVGVYERMSADERIVLLLNVLGREVEVKLPIDAVEAA
ncbi:MAG: transcription termination/antitermination protein NusG [Alphaproteobacteria bacterium]